MYDLYAILSVGGDGHSFLLGCIAHSFLKWDKVFTFPDHNAHNFMREYVDTFTHKIEYSGQYPTFIEKHKHKDDCNIFLAPFGYSQYDYICEHYKNVCFIGVVPENLESQYKIEINHWLKNGRYTDTNMPVDTIPYYDNFIYYVKNKYLNYPLVSFEEFKNNDLYVKETIKLQHVDNMREFSKFTYKIYYNDLMHNFQKTCEFIEHITNIKLTNSLMQTIKNYQNSQYKLELDNSYLYNYEFKR